MRKALYARVQGGRVLHEVARRMDGKMLSRCGVTMPRTGWTRPRRGHPRREICRRCPRTRPIVWRIRVAGWLGEMRR